MKNRFVLLLLCLLGWLSIPALKAADIDVVQARLIGDMLPATSTDATVTGYISSQQANGSWSDINYADRSQVNWLPYAHLERLFAIARAYRTSTSSHLNNVQSLSAFLKGFDYWNANLPNSYNWYKNEIAGPRTLSRAMLLMKDKLTAQQIINARSSLGSAGTKSIGTSSGYTGQNLVWWYDVRVHRGCVEDSAGMISEAFTKIGSEIKIVGTGSDGMRPDFTFHQHGALLYSGGYGLDFSKDSAFYASVSNGTSYAFTTAQVNLLTGLILDHQQWSMRGQTSDFGIIGRALTRPGDTHDGTTFQKICSQMSSLNTPRKSEFDNFSALMTGGG